MHILRRFLLYLASSLGIWLLISFGGAMFNSANAAFWSDSLMWSLLSFMVIAPAFVFVCTPPPDNSVSARRKSFVDETNRTSLPSDSQQRNDPHSHA